MSEDMNEKLEAALAFNDALLAQVARLTEQKDTLMDAIRLRHLAGGLGGHSPGCVPNIVKHKCRCGAIALYHAYRAALSPDDVRQALPPQEPQA